MTMKSMIAIAVTAALAPSAYAQQGQQPQQQWQEQGQQQFRDQGGQPGNTTVGALRGQPLFQADGDRLGTILNIVLNERNEGFLVVRRASDQQSVLAPFDHLLWRDGRLRLVEGTQQSLRNYTEDIADNFDRLRADHRVRVWNYPGGSQTASAGRASSGEGMSSAEGANILVRQPAPRVQVEQAQPTVTVQQPQPHVSVQQPRPQIIVRQPPPVVTVQQQQPEIIVRMPEPDVNVDMPKPDVNVNVPQPQVRFAQPSRKAIEVEPARARVQVIPPEQQARVEVNRAEPQVQYERTGEPRIRYQEPEGEPQIRYERVGSAQQEGAAGATGGTARGGTMGRQQAGER